MKRIIIAFFIIAISFLLQSTVFQAIAIADVVPNILLIVTVFIGYTRGRKRGLACGLVCGLLTDIYFESVIGFCGLLYMGIGYLNGYAHKIYFRDNYTMPVLLVAVSDFIYGFCYYVFMFLLRNRRDFFFYLRRIILPELIYTVVVSIVLYKVLHAIYSRLENAEKKED